MEVKTGSPSRRGTIPPDREAYDPSWYTWSALFRSLASGNELDGRRYVHMQGIANEEKDYAKCVRNRDWLLSYSPIVNFMRMHVQKLGGEFNAKNITCARCDTMTTLKQGGFSPDHGILLCMNHVKKRKAVEDLMAHEMVHAYDMLRFNFDQKSLKHAACTEVMRTPRCLFEHDTDIILQIRAITLSGECRWWREFKEKANMSINMHFQDCVREKAVRSVMARPFCKDDLEAVKVVNSAWESCFSDTRPFDEIYR
ncbi:MAG: Mitochondrial inner membrane protease atp23 [Chrysothrix sp. TS-e1954]|nr:MAG: Mitochondrial inner membrane protease atp23 [Chrysothrix sp. TS-e1954]